MGRKNRNRDQDSGVEVRFISPMAPSNQDAANKSPDRKTHLGHMACDWSVPISLNRAL
jgi:hypothetical protein